MYPPCSPSLSRHVAASERQIRRTLGEPERDRLIRVPQTKRGEFAAALTQAGVCRRLGFRGLCRNWLAVARMAAREN